MTLHPLHKLPTRSAEGWRIFDSDPHPHPEGRGVLLLRLFCLSLQTPHFQEFILKFHKIHRTLSPACGREFLDVHSGRSPKLNWIGVFFFLLDGSWLFESFYSNYFLERIELRKHYCKYFLSDLWESLVGDMQRVREEHAHCTLAKIAFILFALYIILFSVSIWKLCCLFWFTAKIYLFIFTMCGVYVKFSQSNNN